ncbi:hypothetical protein DH2020_022274 [Rehmannia glutinosa]|uniref:Syntaxin-81-like protein n=1 Tax=Rehmannia glutinosa TaxID=99300 RepID=A0ABR0WGJ7_REHGL
MAKVRDRTEDFKDAARRAALNLGYNELESIRALEQFLVKHKKDYVDPHRTTEQERDSIEHEVTVFIKACKEEQIDVLKNSINDEEAKSKGWLGIRNDNLNADTVAHKHGVSSAFQDAINRVTPRRKLKRSGTSDVAERSVSGNVELGEQNNSEVRQTDDAQSEPIRFQQQLLDDETRALQVELASMLDAVQETETKMVEMSALNHLMSTHVLQQAQQIEFLYEQAVEATKNVELGNKELSQAIQRNSSSRTFLLLFLFVLTFSIIFLDCFRTIASQKSGMSVLLPIVNHAAAYEMQQRII